MNGETIALLQTCGILMILFFFLQFLVIKLAMRSQTKKIRNIVKEEMQILYYLIFDDEER